MAYFSNGTEGMEYESRYCDRCVHQPTCMVWFIHMECNYLQHEKSPTGELAKQVLNNLIPRSHDGLSNEQCRMFHPRTAEEEAAVENKRNPAGSISGADKPAPWIQDWLAKKHG